MNNPENFPVDVAEQIEWILAHKEARGFSWSKLADVTGIPAGTLSPVVFGKYAGNVENVARKIFRYRQMVESQAERGDGVPTEPGYFETPTSRRIQSLLVYAHMGRMTVCATGPGTGKTITVKQYQNSVSNCWVATMWRTDKSMASMISKVLRSVGGDAKRGWTRQLSHQIADAVTGKRGILVIDEANHLETDALEEIRAWHDATGVGVCLLGNEELMMRITGGPRKDAFARLNSRIGMSHVQTLPIQGDVDAFCDAWDLQDPAMRAMLARIALTPGTGGLRECRMIIEQASMLAIDEGRPLSFADLRDAQSTRTTRNIL